MSTPAQPVQAAVDAIQYHLGAFPAADCPVTHHFTPGLYAREIFMPAGAIVVSRIHKTEHPHAMLAGRILVWTEDRGVVELKAGHFGITQPGTRRVAYIAEDCRWVTFHATTQTDLDKLQDELTTTPDVAYVGESGAPVPEILRKLSEAGRQLNDSQPEEML